MDKIISSNGGSAPGGQKILVVDDDLGQRDLYLELFQAHGYAVTGAVDGLDGLEKSLKQKPDLVFTGIIMPRMDGFQMIEMMRKNVMTATTPIILFSHLGREEDRQKASELPNTEFLVKGYDSPMMILKRVKDLLAQAPKG